MSYQILKYIFKVIIIQMSGPYSRISSQINRLEKSAPTC